MDMLRVLLLSVLLVACASNQPVASLPSNVTLSAPGSWNERYIDEVTFTGATTLGTELFAQKAGACLAMQVRNDGYTLQDSSASFVGAYTGNFYEAGASLTQHAEQSHIHVADKIGFASGSGNLSYSDGGLIPIGYILRYGVALQKQGNGYVMRFGNLSYAQQDTGFAQNAGFRPLGSWQGAKPMLAYDAIDNLHQAIRRCLT